MICMSFASRSHYIQQDAWEQSCKNAGFDNIIKYREEDIPEEQRICNYGSRGYGFWFWKPYLIRKTLLENDSVIYTDTDYSLVDGDAIKAMLAGKDVALFNYPFQNRIWTKRDCFFYMDCDGEKYWNTQHLEAGISFWNKTNNSLALLKEWIFYTHDRRIISDDPNVSGMQNLPEFKDHRHDQSILTNLKERHGIQTLPIGSLKGIINGSDI